MARVQFLNWKEHVLEHRLSPVEHFDVLQAY